MLLLVNELGVYVLVLQYKHLLCKQASLVSSRCFGGGSIQTSRVLFLEKWQCLYVTGNNLLCYILNLHLKLYYMKC